MSKWPVPYGWDTVDWKNEPPLSHMNKVLYTYRAFFRQTLIRARFFVENVKNNFFKIYVSGNTFLLRYTAIYDLMSSDCHKVDQYPRVIAMTLFNMASSQVGGS